MRISYPRSTLPPRDDDLPEVLKDETILLQGQGAHRDSPFSGWRPAQAFLTDQRFILYLRPKIRLFVPLPSIHHLSTERQYCLLKKREVLCIVYRTGSTGKSTRIWFVANDLKNWQTLIHQLSLLKVDRKTLGDLAIHLDSDGQDILWYLWEKGHANIRQLCEVVDTRDAADVLEVIKTIINPMAQKMMGCPILCFERKRIDPQSGEPILFHWWIMGRGNCSVHKSERLVDIFDEEAYVEVLMEVRGVTESDLRVDVHGHRVTVRSHKIGAALRMEMDLPAEVEPEGYSMLIKNNLLQMRFSKAVKSKGVQL